VLPTKSTTNFLLNVILRLLPTLVAKTRPTRQRPRLREFTGYPTTVPEFPADELGLHPVAKPVGLLEFLIETYTRPGEIVLDSTMGIGSTGIAAANTRRRFIGIENDAKFFQIAMEVLRTSGRASA